MSKWKSKATGSVFDAYDCFDNNSKSSEHLIALFFPGDDWDKDRPRARLKYEDLIEAFEKVEDDEPIREGMYDGWDTE